jgi:hypothetical protein
MSFDAGAVKGSLDFDTSEFTHNMAGVGAALQLFPPELIELVENPLLGAIAIAGELAKALGEGVVDAFKEVSGHALDTGLAAEKAGVSPEFLSQWSELGKTVKISQEQISVGFKFLQKNAVDAADGNQQAMKSFTDLGISQDFLRGHLNDTQAVWEKVHESISALPTAAERSRRAMEVMGRSGSDLTPLFNLSAEAIDKFTATANRLGVIESPESVEAAKKWQVATTQIEEAWEGLKRKAAEPILDVFTAEWDHIEPVLEKVADVIGHLIPVGLELMKDGIQLVLPLLDLMLAGLEGVASVTDALGVSQGAADATSSARDALAAVQIDLNNVHFTVDPTKAASEVADKLKPTIEQGFYQWKQGMGSAHARGKVAHAIGGRR